MPAGLSQRASAISVKSQDQKLGTSDLELELNRTGTQGGVCSAKFWIIAFNEAIEKINSHGAFRNGFADDCVTMISGNNLKSMMTNLQKVVSTLEAWGQTAGLKFNFSKTEVVIFTKKRLKPEHMPQKL